MKMHGVKEYHQDFQNNFYFNIKQKITQHACAIIIYDITL